MTDTERYETISFPDPGRGRGVRVVAEDGRSLSAETPREAIVSDLEHPPNSSLGHYELRRFLGRGGQASTYLALDTRLQRLVVLKRYHRAAAPERREAVLNEGRALARVRSRYVAPCHGVEFEGDETILVVEYIPGRSLAMLTPDDRADFGRSALWSEQVAEGLAEVHACGLLHRDIKPANIILGDDGVPRLVDFGLAAPLASAALQTVSGTPPFMAPEQARGQGERIDARTDVFGLGAVLYFLLTGMPPYPPEGKTRREILEQARQGRPVPPRAREPRVPRSLERICLKAMQPEPQNRYASATEFRQALQRGRCGHNRNVPMVLAGLAIAPVAACALWFGFRPGSPHRPSSDPSAEAGRGITARPTESAAPRVVRLAIRRFSKRGENRDTAKDQGILGEQTFRTQLDDQVTIEAELSQPAYGYLIAFQPDGRVDVCDPEDETTSPAPTLRLRYPGPSKTKEIYSLTDGTGLQAFAVVVSRQPLPSYGAWKQRHGRPPWGAGLPGEPGVVWQDDGEWTLPLMGDDPKGTRGKGATVRGAGATVAELSQWLRSLPGVDAVAVKAFTVEPAAGPLTGP
jgi:serine/threonine protein kinase